MNMNQKELALKANIPEGSLSRYENDIREPKVNVIAKIACALNVSTDYILGLTPNINISIKNSSLNDISELADICNTLIDRLTNHPILIDGEAATKESIDCMTDAIKMGFLLAKERQSSKLD